MTKQVRIPQEWHRKLKIIAAEEGTTISRLLEEACKEFFKEPKGK